MQQQQKDIDGLREDIAALRDDISGLVEAWKTASGVVRFVKWAAALSAAIATLTVSARVGYDIFVHSVKEAIK